MTKANILIASGSDTATCLPVKTVFSLTSLAISPRSFNSMSSTSVGSRIDSLGSCTVPPSVPTAISSEIDSVLISTSVSPTITLRVLVSWLILALAAVNTYTAGSGSCRVFKSTE